MWFPLFRRFKRLSYLVWLSVAALWVFVVWQLVIGLTGQVKTIDSLNESKTYRVFVYGTLTNPFIRWVVTRRTFETAQAELLNYQKQGLDIRQMKGASTPGLVIEVDAESLRRLDRYERLGERYKRFEVQLSDGSKAWVYQLIEEDNE